MGYRRRVMHGFGEEDGRRVKGERWRWNRPISRDSTARRCLSSTTLNETPPPLTLDPLGSSTGQLTRWPLVAGCRANGLAALPACVFGVASYVPEPFLLLLNNALVNSTGSVFFCLNWSLCMSIYFPEQRTDGRIFPFFFLRERERERASRF
ncbi:hypothetical protein B0T22DRAFT_254762 [Podospora appendiculata]|uniref:Uncharacterized protein n=1 Tax=Podospora appendiculata TaxID=314037 RepID=A0AAE0X2Q4_9PEZI|nr:hypothetical protein B0T22DRAFT_254762 [Podospora appendiculata]